MKLIDKEKVEEILRNLWKEDDGHNSEHRICYNKALQEVQCEIDTLERQDTRKWLTQFANCQPEKLQKDKTLDDDLEQFADEWDESLYRSDAVIAGAKWMKEKMIKNAINGVLVDNVDGTQDICLHGNRYGDKVKVIFVKDE